MGNTKKIGNVVVKSVLRDMAEPIGVRKKSRAEAILEHLLEDKKKLEWDMKCHLYYLPLKFVMEYMSNENEMTAQMVKKVYCKYSIFKKVLNPTLKLFLRSIEEYGLTMPQRLSAPLLVEFEITNKCNLACKHCYANAGKEFENELSTKEAKNVLNQLKRAGVPIVCFTGGEPFLRKDLFELLEYAKRVGITIILTTNGTLITKEKAAKLKKIGVDYVRVSLDGSTAKTHDWLRGVPGAFDRTVEGIKNCVNEGIKTGVGTVLINENVHELGDIIDLTAGLGCCDINAIPLIESGRAKHTLNKEFHEISKEQKRINEKIITEKAEKYGNRMLLNFLDLDHIRKTKGFSQKFIGWAQGGCAAGRTVCVIGPNGEIRPCITMRINVGNIRKQSFGEIWKNSKVFEELKDRSLLKGKCGSCEFKYSCGGCRATAYEKYGDYLKYDPSCYMNFL